MFALLLFGSSAQAQNPCATSDNAGSELLLAQSDSGIAGTGRAGGDESGLGGTGLSDADESGVGGTGHSGGDGDESGMGGTGVYGTITAFGSICVNGLRIHYDDATPVTHDGRASTSEVLAIGQVVVVDAGQRGGELSAARVSILSALTGPITQLDAEANRLHIMGQPVIAPDDFDWEVFDREDSDRQNIDREDIDRENIDRHDIDRHGHALKLGSRATVSGLRRGDGVVVATRIVPVERGRRDSVSGIAQWVGPETLEVAGIRIPLDSQDDSAGARRHQIEDGEFVQIFGAFLSESSPENSTLKPSEISAIPLLARPAERLYVEGYVQRLSGDERLWLAGVEIDRKSIERVTDKPKLAERIRATGRRDASGRLRVERVRLVERPAGRPDLDRVKPQKLQKPSQPSKPEKPPQSIDRPPRPKRPTIDRPPRIDRPEKPVRPTKVDRAIRDLKLSR